MLDFFYTYILTWRLPISLAVASIALFPMHYVHQRVRVNDTRLMHKGAIKQTFVATLCIGVATVIYSASIVLIIFLWMYLSRKHVLSKKAWMASILALVLSGSWYYVFRIFLPTFHA